MAIRRPHIPVGVKLHACLLMLGFTDEEITQGGVEWDHNPALSLRIVDPETGELRPHPNDPHHLTPLRAADHKLKTNGTKATTAGSDKQRLAKVRRLEAANAEFHRHVAPKPRQRRKNSWASRPFQKRAP